MFLTSSPHHQLRLALLFLLLCAIALLFVISKTQQAKKEANQEYQLSLMCDECFSPEDLLYKIQEDNGLIKNEVNIFWEMDSILSEWLILERNTNNP